MSKATGQGQSGLVSSRTITGLTPAQLEQYDRDGWVAPVDVMSEAEAGLLLDALETAERNHPEELHAEHRNNAHLVLPFLAELATDSRIVDAAETIVGPDISLWSTVLFIKEPDSAGFVSWHQDGFYMGLNGDNYVTAWLALSPSTRESGCVSVIPGSHQSLKDHTDTFGQDNILTRGQTVSGIDEKDAVDLVLRPGQMSLHHPWLIHGSQPNQSSRRRVGVAMQSYIGAGVAPNRGDHHVVAVRGQPPAAPFVSVPLPTGSCTPEGNEARQQANAALSSVLYHDAETTRRL